MLPLSVHEVVVSKLDESKDEMLKSIVKEISAFGLECWYYNKILDTSNNTQYFRYTEIIQYGFHYIKKHIYNSVYL